MTKKPKKKIWIKSPATMIFSPACRRASVPAAWIPPPNACTKKGDAVTEDEDFRKPFQGDDGVCVAVDEGDEAAENHVD